MLEEIMNKKNEIQAIKTQIDDLRKSSGLKDLEDKLKALEAEKELMVTDAMIKGITKEGTLRIVATGRRMRELNQDIFKEAYPEIFAARAKITITSAVEAIMELHPDLPSKEAKQLANDEIEQYSSVKEPTSWDVISLV